MLYKRIKSPNYANDLQQDLNKILLWADKWQLKFNNSKCYDLWVTKKKNPLLYTYRISRSPLKSVNAQSYLGIPLSKDLYWNDQVANVTKKANSTFFFIRRNLGKCSSETKETCYKSLVRSVLEYVAGAWFPYMQKNIVEIEKVQRRAARFVTGMYQQKKSNTALRNSLKWGNLSMRRTTNRLTIFYKIMNGSVHAISLPNEITRPIRSVRSTQDHSFVPLFSRTERSWRHHLPWIRL